MIVVRLAEGLGNQMFRYAAGRALSLRTDQALRFDLSWYEKAEGHRTYRLDAFDLEIQPVDESLEEPLRVLREKLTASSGSAEDDTADEGCGLTLHGEIFHGFHPEVVAAPGNAYLCGHWQSEGYFADHAEAIRRDFTFRDPLSEVGREFASEIRTETSLGVHVRRGDYADIPIVHAVMGTCSPDYYEQAIARVRAATSLDRIFVFSDDPEWVRAEILPRVGGATLVEGATDVEDLHLMSLCSHHVIANSTFSWWAAWLAEHPDQVVVAPEHWMQRPFGTTDHIVPERWLRV